MSGATVEWTPHMASSPQFIRPVQSTTFYFSPSVFVCIFLPLSMLSVCVFVWRDDDWKGNPLCSSSSPFLHWLTFACKCLPYMIYFIYMNWYIFQERTDMQSCAWLVIHSQHLPPFGKVLDLRIQAMFEVENKPCWYILIDNSPKRPFCVYLGSIEKIIQGSGRLGLNSKGSRDPIPPTCRGSYIASILKIGKVGAKTHVVKKVPLWFAHTCRLCFIEPGKKYTMSLRIWKEGHSKIFMVQSYITIDKPAWL